VNVVIAAKSTTSSDNLPGSIHSVAAEVGTTSQPGPQPDAAHLTGVTPWLVDT
jgi:hypothetical protein